jgi:diguanylate cyclase (GGDEF)-like protein/PAS domain S-box-containing protein
MRAAMVRHAGPGANTPARRGHLTIEAVVIAAALLTVVASYNREALTQREQFYEPSDDNFAFASYQYDDRTEGGTSSVAAGGRPLSWTCNIQKTYEYGYCGYGIIFDQYHTGRGLDLSGFDSISFTLQYEGSANSLRLAIKDLDPRYLDLGAPTNEKVNQASIPVEPGLQTVSIGIDQFSVVDWWQEAAERPSAELARPAFDNVSSLEILTAADSEAGPQAIAVEKIAFHGQTVSTEGWYAGIALAWLLLIGSILVLRRSEVDRWRRRLVQAMATTLDTIPHMVWTLDANGQITFNKRWEQFTGVPLGPGGWRKLRQLIHPGDAQDALKQWRAGLRGAAQFEIELRLLHHSGKHRWVLTSAVPTLDDEGAITGWYGTCTDIHEQIVAQRALNASIAKERRRSEQLKWSSDHDPLTRLPNRRLFEARLDTTLIEAGENETDVGLLLVDLDYFKHTNDTLGHNAGDELLKAIATRLKRAVRRQDLVARIGGDEFAVILPNLKSRSDIAAIGHGVAEAIQVALTIGDHVVRPSASIGGAICPKGEGEPSDFLKWADAALYDLKRSGRGGFRQFESYMLDDVKQAAFQLSRARDAIVDGSIVAVYQPKITIADGEVAGYEALLRIRNPDGSLGLPEMLAEAFNDYELAAKIGETMQSRVIRDIRGWIDAGVHFGRVSINAAPAEFLRNEYAERLLEMLARHRVPPSCIEIEVTEHAFVELGWEYVARALDQLKAAGVAISLDDFGTGHSSLAHIRDFPVDLIKIDRSYTKLITEDGAIASLVTGLVHLVCSLGLEVVAEGVETRQQLDLLKAMGCHFAQGFLLCHPIEKDQVGSYAMDKSILAPAQIAPARAVRRA